MLRSLGVASPSLSSAALLTTRIWPSTVWIPRPTTPSLAEDPTGGSSFAALAGARSLATAFARSSAAGS